jgi:hypothetical protein
MKTFKEFLSSANSAANLTEATVTNDGSVKSLLMMLRNDPKVAELCERITQRKFDPKLLTFDGMTNNDYPTSNSNDNKNDVFIYNRGIDDVKIKRENTGLLDVYYGNIKLIDKSELRRIFTYFDRSYGTIRIIQKWNNEEYGIVFLDDTSNDKKIEHYKLFDMSNPKFFKTLTDPKLQTTYDHKIHHSGVEYRESDVIPADMPKKMVKKLFNIIVEILNTKATGKTTVPSPSTENTNSVSDDAKLSKDFEQFRKLFSALEDTFLEITKSSSDSAPSQSEINKTSAALVAIKTQIVGGRVYGR